MCRRCRDVLRPVAPRLVGNGLVVAAAYRHDGPARVLVHRLKYRAVTGAAAALAPGMVAALPHGAAVLVPVPRARLRAWRHGVDPASALAAEMARLCGLPVARALRGGWWWPAHAGAGRAARLTGADARFRGVASVPHGAVLVDDVLTTGATLVAAARTTGAVIGAVTATAAVYD